MAIDLRESVTYQAIIEEGRQSGAVKVARGMILLLGRERFGGSSAKVNAALNGITDLKKLERLCVRLLRVKSWKELLPTD